MTSIRSRHHRTSMTNDDVTHPQARKMAVSRFRCYVSEEREKDLDREHHSVLGEHHCVVASRHPPESYEVFRLLDTATKPEVSRLLAPANRPQHATETSPTPADRDYTVFVLPPRTEHQGSRERAAAGSVPRVHTRRTISSQFKHKWSSKSLLHRSGVLGRPRSRRTLRRSNQICSTVKRNA